MTGPLTRDKLSRGVTAFNATHNRPRDKLSRGLTLNGVTWLVFGHQEPGQGSGLFDGNPTPDKRLKGPSPAR